MAERTIQDVDKEIKEIEQEINDYRFIAGESWNPFIVSFIEEDGLADYNDPDWLEAFREYKRGDRVGVTEVVLHVNNTVQLSAEDLAKINLHKAIVDRLLFDIADLRKERHELKQQIEETE